MEGAPGRNRDLVWADRLTVRVVNRDFHVRILTGSIEQADSFVAQHLRLWAMAFWRNITFCNYPFSYTDRFAHCSSPLTISEQVPRECSTDAHGSQCGHCAPSGF